MISDVEFDIVEIEELSGDRAHIYSVLLDGEEQSLLMQFFSEFAESNAKEMDIFRRQLYSMGHVWGCKREFFKLYEGAAGDGVAALSIGSFRLYCLYFDCTAVFFGSGGLKPKGVRAYQELPELNEKVEQVKAIAAKINNMIKERDLKITSEGKLQW